MSKKDQTLGDMIKEALERASAKPEAAAQECQCPICVAEREEDEAGESTMTIGSPNIRGVGDEVEVQLITLQDEDAFVLTLHGEGIDWVEQDSGNRGIRFNSPKALREFCDFIQGVAE